MYYGVFLNINKLGRSARGPPSPPLWWALKIKIHPALIAVWI